MVPRLKRMHVVSGTLGAPRLLRQRDIEVGGGGVGLKRARGVHGGLGGGAHEGWSLFESGPHVGRNGDDVLLADEPDQTVEGVAEVRHQLAGRRVIFAEHKEHLLRCFAGINLVRQCVECRAVLMQIRVANLKQLIERRGHHVVIEQLQCECVLTDAEVAVRSRQQIALHP